MELIPITRVVLDDDEIETVSKVLRSGRLRQGPITADFEKEFAKAVGASYGVACSSGTAALHLAYWALLRPGDEVLVPAFTFVATATAALVCGVVPVFVDIDPETILMDPLDAERKITARTRAIAPVHLYGNACYPDRILALAKAYGLKVIWDAAQAHGTRFQGADVGSLPDAVCYSFYPTKNITTGEGGMIVTNDETLAEKLRLLRSHGMTDKYNHVLLGVNYRMTEINAAIGIIQLQKLAQRLERRRSNAQYLLEHIRQAPGVAVVPSVAGGEHSYNQFTIRLDFDVLRGSREEFRKRLQALGVETAVHYPKPVPHQPLFEGKYENVSFPNATNAAATVCSLPVHPFLTREELQRVADAVVTVATQMAS